MRQFKDLQGSDPVPIVGRVFTVVGLILMTVATLLLWKDRSETKHARTVEGKVITLTYSGETCAPVIEFKLEGKRHRIQGTVWSNPPAYEIGERVQVLIPDGNPSHAVVNSWLERYFAIGLLAFLGIVFGGIGVALLFFLIK